MPFHNPEYDPPNWQTRPNELRGIQISGGGGDGVDTAVVVGLVALAAVCPVALLGIGVAAAIANRRDRRMETQLREAAMLPRPSPTQPSHVPLPANFHFKPLPPPLCPSCFWKNPHHPSSCLKDEFPGYRYSITCYQCKDHSAHSAEVTPEKQTERDELLERWNRQMKLYEAQHQARERIYNRTITIFVLFAIIVNCLIVFLLSMPPQKWLILPMTLLPSIGAAVAIGEACAEKIANRKIKKLSEQSLVPGI